jgi:hypothetical protein
VIHKVPPSQVHCNPSIRRGLLEHPEMEQGDWLDKGHVTPTKVPPSQVHRDPSIRRGLLEHPEMEQGDWLDKGHVTPQSPSFPGTHCSVHPYMEQGDWLDKDHVIHRVPPSQVYRNSSIRRGLLENPEMEQGDWLDKGHLTAKKSRRPRYTMIRPSDEAFLNTLT